MRLAAFAVAIAFSACSLSAHARGGTPQPVVVPDTFNNRVLIYKAPTENGQAADVVLGQVTFDTSGAGTGDNAMFKPNAFAFDAAGTLFVSDSGNCRVLIFKPPFTNGMAAIAVLGKPNFSATCREIDRSTATPALIASSGSEPTQTNLGFTAGLAADRHGVWVADSSNNRVVHFPAPYTSGEEADQVLGQSDFDRGDCGILCKPYGVAFDSFGFLWVVNSSYNEVVGFIAPRTGAPINLVLEGAGSGDCYRSLSLPTGLSAGPKGALWVADTENNRVLMYKLTDAKTLRAAILRALGEEGPEALPMLVLGQPNFCSNDENEPGANILLYPFGVVAGRDGSVWASDLYSRTMHFMPRLSNGMDASLVLGQSDFFGSQPNQGGSRSEFTQYYPFYGTDTLNAGPSALAIAVLLALTGLWFLARRRRMQ